MLMSKLRQKLADMATSEADGLLRTLAQLPPEYTDEDLRDLIKAHARAVRITTVMPEINGRQLEEAAEPVPA